MRQNAWDNALHAHGTLEVFSSRSRRLKRITRTRDFLGLAVPICIVFVATTEWIREIRDFQSFALAVLSVVTLIQFLMAAWSLIARWDEELAYCTRATRDSYELKQAWQRIGRNDVDDIQTEYKVRSAQQSIIDSHDIEKDVTNAEKIRGMRLGLIEFQRECASCKRVPRSRRPPWRPAEKCAVCGGN